MKRKLLLISNSTNAGEDYLGWPRKFIKEFLEKNNVEKILFIPYAGVNLSTEGVSQSFDVYEQRVASVFRELGVSLHSIHHESDPVAAVRSAKAIAVGGGNTFHLVKMMHDTGIMEVIRERALSGIPYMGWSAGANVACPTMKTTNDMPISEPSSFDCLNLVPFQINPHYLDANPAGHGGETREQRINEFLVINKEITVAGLRESCLFEVEAGQISLQGPRPVRIFRFGHDPEEFKTGDDLSFLL